MIHINGLFAVQQYLGQQRFGKNLLVALAQDQAKRFRLAAGQFSSP